MSTWHYQIMKHVEPSGEVNYAVHEIYDIGGGLSWTLSPVNISAESAEEVKSMLQTMLNDIEEYDVMDYDQERSEPLEDLDWASEQPEQQESYHNYMLRMTRELSIGND